MSALEGPPLLTAREVAAAFGVDPKTAVRWGVQGVLLLAGTPGSHCRFFAVEVEARLRGESKEDARALAEAERDRLAPSPALAAGERLTGGGP